MVVAARQILNQITNRGWKERSSEIVIEKKAVHENYNRACDQARKEEFENFCQTIDLSTSSSTMWKKCRALQGTLTKQPRHPNAEEKANELENFAARCTGRNLREGDEELERERTSREEML